MKHAPALFLCFFPAAIWGADPIQLKTPHTGDTDISGHLKAIAPGTLINVTRTHQDGHSETISAPTNAKGDFTANLPAADKLNAGDKVTATPQQPAGTAAGGTALPSVVEIVPTSPPIFRFASSLKEAAGAKITVHVDGATGSWPQSILGDQSVTVIADDAFQFGSGVKLGGTPSADPSTLTVTLVPDQTVDASTVTVEDALCDWGRVRCYAYFGSIFSQKNGDFSNADPYLDFTTEWNWYKGKRGIFTGFFDVRLTSIPAPDTSAKTTPSTTTTATASGTGSASSITTGSQSAMPSAANAFASSSKSPQVQGGFYYAPWVAPVWKFKDDSYGMFAAALYKGGVQGRLDGSVDVANLAYPNQGKSVYTFNSGGARLGFVKWYGDPGEAHDLLSYLDFTLGKYRLYDYVGPDFQDASGGGLSDIRHYGLRKAFEGRIKIPKVNLRLGVDANLGQGQNDLRFVVTTNAIDIFKNLLGQK